MQNIRKIRIVCYLNNRSEKVYVGKRIFINNRYEILSRVGAGGMSDVYKAKDHKLNRNVAIKVLKNEFSKDKKFCVQI